MPCGEGQTHGKPPHLTPTLCCPSPRQGGAQGEFPNLWGPCRGAGGPGPALSSAGPGRLPSGWEVLGPAAPNAPAPDPREIVWPGKRVRGYIHAPPRLPLRVLSGCSLTAKGKLAGQRTPPRPRKPEGRTSAPECKWPSPAPAAPPPSPGWRLHAPRLTSDLVPAAASDLPSPSPPNKRPPRRGPGASEVSVLGRS